MQLLYMRLGTNDLARSRTFYDATFGVLGLAPSMVEADPPFIMYDLPGGPKFAVGEARNGEPATHANGGTIMFSAESDEQVAAWHAAGLAHGGSCEGVPEPKPRANNAFGAYLRDPDGNKLCCYHGLSFG